MKITDDNEVLYHIGLSRNMIAGANHAILINDKKYIDQIARILDVNAKHINENREYYSCLANYCGKNILVISTGLGGPAMAIGIEELAMIGIKYFVRLGETGAIQENIEIGDLVLSKASVRLEGTSGHYAPECYPAVASLEMTNTFHEILQGQKLRFHYGITVTADTAWTLSDREYRYLKYVPREFHDILDEWKRLNILSVDMELATLFTLCNVFGLEAVAVLDVVNKNFGNDRQYYIDDNTRLKKWKIVLKNGLEKLIC